MNILWLSWKDRQHPLAGGAETISGELMDRLVRDGHNVRMITAHYPGSSKLDTINGTNVFRTGNRYTVYLQARSLYRAQFQDWPDVVIDEMNTIPFGSAFYSPAKNILLAYQLAREVWHYQMPFPFSTIGYFIEPFMLRLLAKRYKISATESNSTKRDLARHGFTGTQIFRVGIDLPHLAKLKPKHDPTSILSLGAVRPMKRTLDAVKAFESAKDQDPRLTMVIAGDISSSYAKKVLHYVKHSRYHDAVDIKGRVTYEERLRLMRESGIILVTSVKEGWGLIVTEAGSQGTPAIVYDTDGLRDSVKDQKTGILCRNGDHKAMGSHIISLLSNRKKYEKIRHGAHEWSQQFTFENSYQDFVKILLTKE